MPDKPDLSNRFVARAVLYNEQTDAQARRLAAAMDQPPANTQDVSSDPARLAAAWNYTTSQNPAQDFWALHAQELAANMSKVPPDAPPEIVTAAHNAAETAALNAIYPYRGELIGVGTKVVEDQVSQADRIKRIVDGHLENQGAAPAPMMAPEPIAPPAQMQPPAQIAPPPPMAPTGGPM